MSWDVALLNTPSDIRNVEALSGLIVVPLGPLEAIQHQIAATLPKVDMRDATWGS